MLAQMHKLFDHHPLYPLWMRFPQVCKRNLSKPIVYSCFQGYHELMDGLITKNLKESIQQLALVEYLRKGKQGDHNIQFRKTFNHQEDQRIPFHTQVSGYIICPLHSLVIFVSIFCFYHVANSNTVLSLSRLCLVLILLSYHFYFFSFAAIYTISTAIMWKICLFQLYTNLAYVPPP